MDNLGLFDQFFYKADQYNVLKAVMGGASILEPASTDLPLDARAKTRVRRTGASSS
jgi:hypothetical protein